MAAAPVTLDTNGLFALLNRQDRLHDPAVAVYRQLLHTNRQFLITDWVVAETGNGQARTAARQSFRAAITLLLDDPRTTCVNIDERRTRHALDRYHERADKTWGLVDCSTMLIMEERGSIEVFTSDSHFEQAGFNALLRDVGATEK